MKLRVMAKKAWQKKNEQRTNAVHMSLYQNFFSTVSRKNSAAFNRAYTRQKKKLEKKLFCKLENTFDMHFGTALEMCDKFDDDTVLLCLLYMHPGPGRKLWHLVALNACADDKCRNKHVGVEIHTQADIHQATLDEGRYYCMGFHGT